MLAAVHLDNLLFLLFIAIAIFFQILTKAATKGRRRPGDTRRRSTSPSQVPRPLPREPDETDEERVRKFLEALGQPTTSKPPEPIKPRPTYQRPTVLPHVPPPLQAPLPPLTTRPPESAPATKSAAEAYAIATQPIAKSVETKIDLATLLRSTSGLRDAIILREIFGPPRSLQPLDLVGIV